MSNQYNKYELFQLYELHDGEWLPMGEYKAILIEENSEDCGYVPIIYSSYTESRDECKGYDLYSIETTHHLSGYSEENLVEYSSTTEETLIEENSEHCGYMPIYSSYTETYENCDGNSLYKYDVIHYLSGYPDTELIEYSSTTEQTLIEECTTQCMDNNYITDLNYRNGLVIPFSDVSFNVGSTSIIKFVQDSTRGIIMCDNAKFQDESWYHINYYNGNNINGMDAKYLPYFIDKVRFRWTDTNYYVQMNVVERTNNLYQYKKIYQSDFTNSGEIIYQNNSSEHSFFWFTIKKGNDEPIDTGIYNNFIIDDTHKVCDYASSAIVKLSDGTYGDHNYLGSYITDVVYTGPFMYNTDIVEINLPNDVTTIEENAFEDCSNLTSIVYEGTIAQWNAISKGNDWKLGVPTSCVVHCYDGNIPI